MHAVCFEFASHELEAPFCLIFSKMRSTSRTDRYDAAGLFEALAAVIENDNINNEINLRVTKTYRQKWLKVKG